MRFKTLCGKLQPDCIKWFSIFLKANFAGALNFGIFWKQGQITPLRDTFPVR